MIENLSKLGFKILDFKFLFWLLTEKLTDKMKELNIL